MTAGYLSEFFTGVALKTISAVEADTARSRQHEFNGAQELIRVFGRATEKHSFPARFIYLNDDDPPLVEDASVTWYDARLRHRTRTEHRMYFPTTGVSECAAEGDLLVVGRQQDGPALVIIAQGGSTIANQIRWLFGAPQTAFQGFLIREEPETEQDRIQFASTFILEQIGVIVDASEETYLDAMLERFGGTFPVTREFSAYARSTLPQVDSRDDPDGALMAWMEREEILFRTLEKHLLAERLSKGFAGDTEGFLQFSLSVLNRRKSRAGLALENHLAVIFTGQDIRYERAARTEGKARPDFLFPGGKDYRDHSFDASLLTMLGVKSTCKDRWRQVLAEAARIEPRHLLTLEVSISRDQTQQMKRYGVQLVVPRGLHSTYSPDQLSSLMDLRDFIDVVRERQRRAFGAGVGAC
jgi:hypothetical protein